MNKQDLIGKLAIQVGPENSLSIGRLYVIRPYVYDDLDREDGAERNDIVDVLDMETSDEG